LKTEGYPILERGVRWPGAEGRCALAVMSKAPRPGKVKTRLQPPLSAEEAAALNVCFLRDTTENIAAVAAGGGAQGLVCYTPIGDEEAFDGLLPPDFGLISQRGDGFGERLHCAAEDILSCGFTAVCLIDSDSPTVPETVLQEAVAALAAPGERVVLGPSHDGGYYLIGLKALEPRVFECITWSTPSVYTETVERVREASLELQQLPIWYDVDDATSLATLQAELLHGQHPPFARTAGYSAPRTRDFLAERAAR
jgi:rSAM/selenodomain-associated transferase 1